MGGSVTAQVVTTGGILTLALYALAEESDRFSPFGISTPMCSFRALACSARYVQKLRSIGQPVKSMTGSLMDRLYRSVSARCVSKAARAIVSILTSP